MCRIVSYNYLFRTKPLAVENYAAQREGRLVCGGVGFVRPEGITTMIIPPLMQPIVSSKRFRKVAVAAVCVFLVTGTTGLWLSRNNNRRLILALNSNDTTEVKRLLAQGANPNSTEGVLPQYKGFPFCDTALEIAAKKGNTEAVKLLLKYGARVSQGGGCGDMELDYAEQQGLTEMIHLLRQQGAKKNRAPVCL